MGLLKYWTFIVLFVILYVAVSGCLNQDNFGDKYNRTMIFTNEALNATVAVWNPSGHNSTIDNSSIYLTCVYSMNNETTISTFRFNTTDGKTHTVNISNYRNTNSIVVLDIDNISITYPVPSQISFIANPYLNTTGGIYNIDLTANVYDVSGYPVVDGTIVNFNIHAPDVIFNGITTDSPYNPFLNGSLNGNISQYTYVPTIGGKAVVHYGWFPDNKIPSGFVLITAAIDNAPSVNSTLYLEFNGTTYVGWTIVPDLGGICDATPSPT